MANKTLPASTGYFNKQMLEILKKGEQKNIPYMIGFTSEDMYPFFMYQMAKQWGVTCRKQNKKLCFGYYFTRQLPGDDKGAWHSSDLWYWFGTLDNSWRPWENRDRYLCNEMLEYFMYFIKNGNPNGGYLEEWYPIKTNQKKFLHIGQGNTKMATVPIFKLLKTTLKNRVNK